MKKVANDDLIDKVSMIVGRKLREWELPLTLENVRMAFTFVWAAEPSDATLDVIRRVIVIEWNCLPAMSL